MDFDLSRQRFTYSRLWILWTLSVVKDGLEPLVLLLLFNHHQDCRNVTPSIVYVLLGTEPKVLRMLAEHSIN